MSTTGPVFPTNLSQLVDDLSLGGAITGALGQTAHAGINAVASGSAYVLTATMAAVVFGAVSPILTIPTAGLWRLWANIQTSLAGVTLAAAAQVNYKLRCTNNTVADLTDSARSSMLMPVTLLTIVGPQTIIGPIDYQATAGDTVQLYGGVSAAIGIGSASCSSAGLYGFRRS